MRSTCSGVRTSIGAQGTLSRGSGASEGPLERCGRPPSRRRDRGRPHRSSGPSLAPLPRLKVPWAPIEVLTPEQVERIVQAAYRILEEAGLEIRSAAAREVYRRAGASVDESTQMVRQIGR